MIEPYEEWVSLRLNHMNHWYDLHYISMIEPNQNNSFFICVGVRKKHMSDNGHVFNQKCVGATKHRF